MMSDQIDLKSLERRAWSRFFQDGLWDIFLGVILLAMAVSAYLDTTDLTETVKMGIFIGIEVVGMAMMWLGKLFITKPRLGSVKFSKKRTRKRLGVAALLTLSVILAVVLWLVSASQGESPIGPNIFVLLWSVNCAVVFGGMAFLLDFDRLYLIGGLYALMVPADFILKKVFGISAAPVVFGVTALFIIGMGVVILVRFLNRYSVPEQGAYDD